MSTPENQVPEMPSSTKLISTLAVVAMISGLLVVLVYEFTKPIIALFLKYSLKPSVASPLLSRTTN
jgi:Na+-translocating ferredoxin:NAD+ oxidoreductase RnfG subunit